MKTGNSTVIPIEFPDFQIIFVNIMQLCYFQSNEIQAEVNRRGDGLKLTGAQA